MPEQPSTPQVTKTEVEQAIEIALLKNNEHLLKEFRTDIEHSSDKIAKALNERTEPLLSQVVELAKQSGAHEKALSSLNGKLIGVSAGAASISGLIVYLITVVTGK